MRKWGLPMLILAVALIALPAAQAGQYAEDLNLKQFLHKYPAIGYEITFLTGETPARACKGFKNLAQCLTASHIAENLGLTFDCLKSGLLRGAAPNASACPTGLRNMRLPFLYRTRLRQAIQNLQPGVDPKAVINRATSQVVQDGQQLHDCGCFSGYAYLEDQQTW